MRLRLLVPRGGRGRGLGGLAAALAAVALVLVVAPDAGRRAARAATGRADPDADAHARAGAARRSRRRPVAGRRHHRAEPEPVRARRRAPGGRAVSGAGATSWCGSSPSSTGSSIVWDDAPARARAPAGPGQARPRLHARQAAVRALRRRPATSCGRSPRASARAAGRRWWCSPARRSGRPRPPRGCRRRRAAAPAAPRDAAGLPALVVGRARPGRGRGRADSLPQPVERAQPPVLHLAPAQGVRRALARRGRSRPTPRLARAARAELAEHGRGDHELVLGEMAGILEPSARATVASPEMIRGLPRELVCAAPVWSQHAYIGGTDPVATVKAALAARRCPRGTRSGSPRPASARRRAASRSRAGSPASAGLPAAAPAPARLARRPARDASPPSTRCARTTCSRPASSPPTSRAPGRRCASGRPGRGARRRSRARRRRASTSRASARPGQSSHSASVVKPTMMPSIQYCERTAGLPGRTSPARGRGRA